jgi:hypothetical protein
MEPLPIYQPGCCGPEGLSLAVLMSMFELNKRTSITLNEQLGGGHKSSAHLLVLSKSKHPDTGQTSKQQ